MYYYFALEKFSCRAESFVIKISPFRLQTQKRSLCNRIPFPVKNVLRIFIQSETHLENINIDRK